MKKFSELQMSTAVEGKSQEYIVKSLEEAQEERQGLRAKNVELQKEVDELRGVNLQQQTQLLDHQNTKLALAEAESKVNMRPHRQSMQRRRFAKLQEQKALLAKEVEIRQAAMERARARRPARRRRAPSCRKECDDLNAQLEELQKKSKLCVIM
eukprot:jgi/Tetstr1/434672/TSEL_023763.t1